MKLEDEEAGGETEIVVKNPRDPVAVTSSACGYEEFFPGRRP
jgi:hypothetical protein